jgi:predicted nucleotide-binding protein
MKLATANDEWSALSARVDKFRTSLLSFDQSKRHFDSPLEYVPDVLVEEAKALYLEILSYRNRMRPNLPPRVLSIVQSWINEYWPVFGLPNGSLGGWRAIVRYLTMMNSVQAELDQLPPEPVEGTCIEPEKEAPSQQGAISGRVFIGHGHSAVWRDIKDFLVDRLGLTYEEFNREPPAGKSNKERLQEMLATSSFALIIMTGEDEAKDGKPRARENVVHEAGLFQAKLGFDRAIIVLEEGCEPFSNIDGLVQLRFPRGNIMAVSEEIRRTFEREGLISNLRSKGECTRGSP